MKNIFLYLILFFLVLLLFAGFFFFYETRYFVGRASISTNSFSVDNSYVFLTPLRARADKKEKIRITVFVLNNQGLGVPTKKVILGTDPNLIVEAIQETTDNLGKAIFDVSSSKSGEYYLEVKVETSTLPQKAHLSFY